MQFRKTKFNDIDSILSIVSSARKKFKESGINQWQGEYPAASDFEKDIMNNSAYVLESDGEIIGMASISFGKKKEYEEIDGSWITNDAYAVINRVGVSKYQQGKGVSHKLLDEIEKICLEKGVYSIRIDTCSENNIMRRLIDSRGYKYCGITQGFGGLRNAYEKTLNSEILVNT